MPKIKRKQRAKLLHQIVADMKASIEAADAAVEAALAHAQAGRSADALREVLEVEPRLHDAQRLVRLAAYVKGLGKLEV